MNAEISVKGSKRKMLTPKFDQELNIKELTCVAAVLKVKVNIDQLELGKVLRVIAGKGPAYDISAVFSRRQKIVAIIDKGDLTEIYIEKIRM